MAAVTAGKKRRPASQLRDRQIPLLERIMGLLGLAFVLLAIGTLLHDAFTGRSLPPDIVVTVEEVMQADGGYLVLVRAENRGDQTAAAVAVRGELRRDGRIIETSEIVFDYLPDGSVSRGGLFFAEDPRQDDLEVRARGFTEP